MKNRKEELINIKEEINKIKKWRGVWIIMNTKPTKYRIKQRKRVEKYKRRMRKLEEDKKLNKNKNNKQNQ